MTLSQFDSITLYGRFSSVLNFCKLEFCEEDFNSLLFLTGTGQDSKKKNQEMLQATFKNILVQQVYLLLFLADFAAFHPIVFGAVSEKKS